MILLLIKCIIVFIIILNLTSQTLRFFKLHQTKHQHGFQNESSTFFKVIRLVINFTFQINSKLLIIMNSLLLNSGDSSKNPVITEIIVYPIKSLPGISVTSWNIDEFGLDCDRMYMLGKYNQLEKRFDCVSMRKYPQLSKVSIELLNDDNFVVSIGNKVYFTVPKKMTVTYLDSNSNINANENHEFDVSLWDIGFKTLIINVQLNQFLIDLELPTDIKLLYSITGKLVKTNSPITTKNVKNFEKLKDETLRTTKFQDYFPILLMSQNDINYLNYRIQLDYPDLPFPFTSSTNFRPNIVISDRNRVSKESSGIDDWYEIQLINKSDRSQKPHNLLITSKCPRCSMVNNINEKTFKFDKTNVVLKTLKNYRKVDFGCSNYSFFGVYLIQLEVDYEINVGDSVKLLRRKLNSYKFLE